METTQMFIYCKLNKYIMVYTCIIIMYYKQNEQITTDTNVEEHPVNIISSERSRYRIYAM